jgi:type I restriction enzyme R subunit
MFKQMIGRGTRLFPEEDKLSFDIIDYSGATSLFEDPEFDGPAERVVEEEIDGDGNVVDDTVVEEPKPPFDPDEPDDAPVDPDDLEVAPKAKFYVGDIQVWVTAEAIYHLDPETHRLRLVEYRDFVVDTVRSLFSDPSNLRSQWGSRVGRQDVLEMLEGRGIDASELADRTGMVEADPFDVLVHLAWNQPLATRTDRARRVRKEHADFFAEFQPAARDVLARLLDKYTEYGITQLDDLGVLEVPPISTMGSPTELANRFGSVDALHQVVSKLGELLYAA